MSGVLILIVAMWTLLMLGVGSEIASADPAGWAGTIIPFVLVAGYTFLFAVEFANIHAINIGYDVAGPVAERLGGLVWGMLP